jgi:hypothetical protein
MSFLSNYLKPNGIPILEQYPKVRTLSTNISQSAIYFGKGALGISVLNILSLTRHGLGDGAKIIKSPDDAAFRMISFLQFWRPLWNDKGHKTQSA